MAEKKHAGGRPRKWKSPEEMSRAIEAYFATCDEKEDPYTVTGLALALGMTRLGLLGYGERDEFASTVEKAKLRVQAGLERWLYRGKGWGPGLIFGLKNNYGWKDVQGIEHSGNVTLRFDKQDEAA